MTVRQARRFVWLHRSRPPQAVGAALIAGAQVLLLWAFWGMAQPPSNSLVDDAVEGAVAACSFSGDTEVATAEGEVAIAEIEPGDAVLAYDQETGATGYYPVTAVWSHEDPVVVRLTIDGELIETTSEHPFYVAGQGWLPADDLRTGSLVRDAGGTYDAVEAVAVVRSPQVMYNLTVAAAHTYFVGGGQWLVHNGCSALARALGKPPVTGAQAHHIVPKKDGRSKSSQAILEKFGIGIDSKANGIYLPTSKTERIPGYENAPNHQPINTNQYHLEVERRLGQAITTSHAEQILNKIGIEILEGRFPFK